MSTLEAFIEKDGKQLRLGYTTGSCAAAAAKAAAWMLLTGKRKDQISIHTPKGVVVELAVSEITMTQQRVSCAIQKDSGDDPDVTNGMLIYAEVSRSRKPGVFIEGGKGVGRVTKPGLDQPVGNAAINSVPRRMIQENLLEVMGLTDYSGGLDVVISVPDGERLASKTFNPRLGIVNGISILGTTGIVEPMSEKALVDTIRVELRQHRQSGAEYALLTPGNYGSDFIRESLGVESSVYVQTSNFIGESLDICRQLGFRGALLIGHIGKLVKIGGGMMNTHSKYGDCRMEILAAQAGACGADKDTIQRVLECVACDDAVRILSEAKICGETMQRLTDRIAFHLKHRTAGELETGAIVFSKEYGILGKTQNADDLLKIITEG